ncbi:rubredoxin, partial [Bowmanella sp. Y57]|nr:rubredoxin [Bowmanella yangjiangensis]
PDDGIVAGTRWEDVPEDWQCPECKVGKEDFEMLDISPVVAAAAAPLSTPLPVPPQPQPQQAVAADVRQPIVIIGSGYAGYGLAQALRRADAEV